MNLVAALDVYIASLLTVWFVVDMYATFFKKKTVKKRLTKKQRHLKLLKGS